MGLVFRRLVPTLILCAEIVASARTYCTRTFHSAIIVNDTLYVDGGELRYLEDDDSITADAGNDLQMLDLSRSWANTDSDLFVSIRKPAGSDPSDGPPTMSEGTVFSDGSNLFFYGGYVRGWRQLRGEVPAVATWLYSIHANSWSKEGFGGVPIERLASGMAAQSPENIAYYLGGFLSPGGNPSVFGTPGADDVIVQGMLVLNQTSLQWSNVSTTDLNPLGTVCDGFFEYLGLFGERGILVAFGGFTRDVGSKISQLAATHTSTVFQNSMETISIYDIASETWHTQKTSGDIPNWRMSGCSVVVAAQDNSSVFIYIFGGMSNTISRSDGSVYVLVLPSFKWIRVTHDLVPRIKLKCGLMGLHTLLTIGGTIPADNNEYEPSPANCDSGRFQSGLGIFDLRTHTWLSRYDADDKESYTIHSKISEVIGGGPTGGVTLKSPEGGYGDSELSSIFAPTSTRMNPQPTRTNADTSQGPGKIGGRPPLTRGAIAGVAVGAVCGLAVVLFSIYYIKRPRRLKRQIPKLEFREVVEVNTHRDALCELDPTVKEPAELHGETLRREQREQA